MNKATFPVLLLLATCLGLIAGQQQQQQQGKEKVTGHVTVLTREQDVPGLLVLVHSLRNFTQKPIVVLLGEGISAKTESILKRHPPISVIARIGDLPIPPADVYAASPSMGSPSTGFHILHIWRLGEFSRLLYSSVGMLYMREGIDELFDSPPVPLAATSDTCPRFLFHPGMLLIQPNITAYNEMRTLLPLPSTYVLAPGIQGLLNSYYPDWEILKMNYHFMKIFQCNRPRTEAFVAGANTFTNVKALEYLGRRPWECPDKQMDCNDEKNGRGDLLYAHHDLHRLWWQHYDALCSKFPCPTATTM